MLSAITSELELEAPSTVTGVSVRKAAMRDIPAILGLINGYAAAGVMLPRTEFELSENMRDFAVAHAGAGWLGAAHSIFTVLS